MEGGAHSESLFAGVQRFPVPRRRGGQPGNRNRYRHGGFSKAARAQHEAVRALIRKLDRLIVIAKAIRETEMMKCKRPPPGLRPYSAR